MLNIRQSSQSLRPAWSALSVLALLFTAWAAAAVAGAIRAAESFTSMQHFSVHEVLAASWPYSATLLPLLALLVVVGARRGAWASQSQVVKLGIIVAVLAGATAWLMVAYSAALSELGGAR